MNKQDIIRMAREAGMDYLQYISPEAFEKVVVFADLVASAEREASVGALRTLNETYELELRKAIADEREACAKVCENKETLLSWPTHAAAIRARGQA